MQKSNSNESIDEVPDDNFLNRDFSRGFLAGFIVVVGFLLATLFRYYLLVEPYNFVTELIINLFIPFVIIYFFARFVTKSLRNYGFAGFYKGENLTLTKIAGVLLGALVTILVLAVGVEMLDDFWLYLDANEINDRGLTLTLLLVFGLSYMLVRRLKSR